MEGAAWNLLMLPARCIHTTWTLPLGLTVGSGIRVSPPLRLPPSCVGCLEPVALASKDKDVFGILRDKSKFYICTFTLNQTCPLGVVQDPVCTWVCMHMGVCVCALGEWVHVCLLKVEGVAMRSPSLVSSGMRVNTVCITALLETCAVPLRNSQASKEIF